MQVGFGLRKKVLGAVVGMSIATAAMVPMGPGGAQAGVSRGPITKSYAPTTGVKFTTLRYPGVPNEIRILKVIPSSGPSIDIATPGPDFPMYGKTSGMSAAQVGSVAGVNGDFGRQGPNGMPAHITMIDGELWTSGAVSGAAFGWTHDGDRAFVGVPNLDISLAGPMGNRLLTVAEWNVGKPVGSAVGGYTRRGGTVTPPPGVTSPTSTDPRWCAVRLTPETGYGYRWSNSREEAITRRYIVNAQPEPCSKKPLSLALGGNLDNVVLAAKAGTDAAARILGLTVGDRTKMRWEVDRWPGITDIMGGSQRLLDDGVNVAPDWESGADNILWYNPRTSVGIVPGCKDRDPATLCVIYIMTIDGRQVSSSWFNGSNWSKGVKLPGLADEMKKLGVVDAVNLDGGGSTTMWLRKKNSNYCQVSRTTGCLVNRPSYRPSGVYDERTIIEALTVLSGVDTGTPTGLR